MEANLENELEEYILDHLNSKGYTKTIKALKEDAKTKSRSKPKSKGKSGKDY